MDSRSISEEKRAGDAEVMDSRQQPVWHVIVLGFFSMAYLYVPYWVFKTYRDLKRECQEVNGAENDAAAREAGIATAVLSPVPDRKPDLRLDEHTRETLRIFGNSNPLLRGIGTFVPFLNLYLLTVLTVGICNLVPQVTSFPRRRPILATLLVLGIFTPLFTTARLPGLWFMVSYLAMAPIAVLQHWLNRYWASVESDVPMVRHGFNLWEMLAIIVGASLTGLVVAGNMIGIKPH